MKRIEFTAKIKVAAFQRSKGYCENCKCRLVSAEYDHRVPLMMGGESTLENCQVYCKTCHAAKTHKEDVPRIAKAKRIEAKHIGAKRPKQKLESRGFSRTFADNTKTTTVRF